MIVDEVEFRRIDTDIGKQKRAARRIPGPLAASNYKLDIDEIRGDI